jgi:hypothetical protein
MSQDRTKADAVGRSPHTSHQPPHRLAAFFVSSLTDVCIVPPIISVRYTTITIFGQLVHAALLPQISRLYFLYFQKCPKTSPGTTKSCGAVVARRSYKIRQTLMTSSRLCGCRGFEVRDFHNLVILFPLLTYLSAPPGLEISLLFCSFCLWVLSGLWASCLLASGVILHVVFFTPSAYNLHRDCALHTYVPRREHSPRPVSSSHVTLAVTLINQQVRLCSYPSLYQHRHAS